MAKRKNYIPIQSKVIGMLVKEGSSRMGGFDRAYLQAYIDEFFWRRNCTIHDLDGESSQLIFNRFIFSLNTNFAVDVDFTDRY